ncbi:MAG: hypothetical protein ACRDP4_04785, partial [Nocardioidaceae bacterium]
MFIQDSSSRIMEVTTLRLVDLLADEPKGGPPHDENGLNSPRTDLHVRPYEVRHVRSYADTGVFE